jgi:hypothetical protein
MAKGPAKRDLLVIFSDYIAYHKGVPVLLGVGLVLVGLILTFFPALGDGNGLLGWVVRNHFLLYVGTIVGLVGILLGDAL